MARLRWGLIGCGDVARKRVAEALRRAKGSELVAACRRDPQALEAFCREFDVPRGYCDAEELLNDDSVDAVYIATPVVYHEPLTVAAAQRGKHVLVEKPMARSTAECDRMIAACEEAGVLLGVAYYRRFYPVVRRIAELLEEEAIGQPLAAAIVTANPFECAATDAGYWRVVPELGGGGALMDIGSHRIDLLLHWFGPLEDVKAHVATVAAEYECENCASLTMRLARGVHAQLLCLFGTPGDPDSCAIWGTAGQLDCTPLNTGTLRIRTRSGERIERHPPASNYNLPLVEDFVDAVRRGGMPRVTGREGRETNRVIERAYREAGMRWRADRSNR